eukprot:scaffold597_cov176-Amphora_coffeaeformis.AAC.20
MISTLRCSFLLLVFLLAGTTTDGCSCMGPVTIESSYKSTDVAVRVLVERQVKANKQDGIFADRVYVATIEESYKSCEAASSLRKSSTKIEIITGADGGLCGVDLDAGQEYILFGFYSPSGNSKRPSMRVGLCQYQRLWSDLTAEQIDYLEGSKGCFCGGADDDACGEKLNFPQAITCPDKETTPGQSDFCMYDQGECSWEPIECPTCMEDWECKSGQSCIDGLCTA